MEVNLQNKSESPPLIKTVKSQKPIGKVRMSTVDAFMIASDGNMERAEQ